MKKYNVVFAIISLTMALTGCASTAGVRRGVIVMKTSSNEAHASLGSDEVEVGDHVDLYKNNCPPPFAPRGGQGPRKCTKEGKGHGEIIEVINENYSVVRFSDEVQFKEGDVLEKKIH